MRKIAIAAIFAAFMSQNLFAWCYYAPCHHVIQSAKLKAIHRVNIEFDKLDSSLVQLDHAYGEYLQALKEQNKLLDKLLRLHKENARLKRKINFLSKQNNLLEGELIDLFSTRKIIDKKIDELLNFNALKDAK